MGGALWPLSCCKRSSWGSQRSFYARLGFQNQPGLALRMGWANWYCLRGTGAAPAHQKGPLEMCSLWLSHTSQCHLVKRKPCVQLTAPRLWRHIGCHEAKCSCTIAVSWPFVEPKWNLRSPSRTRSFLRAEVLLFELTSDLGSWQFVKNKVIGQSAGRLLGETGRPARRGRGYQESGKNQLRPLGLDVREGIFPCSYS